MDTLFVGVYWGPRDQSLENCAIRVLQTFEFLHKMDESFHFWYSTHKPKKKEIIQPKDLSIKGGYELLEAGRSFDDFGRLLPDLGYRIYLKSDLDFANSHVLSISCGCTHESLPNKVLLDLSKSDRCGYLREFIVAEKIYKRLMEIWDGEKGVIRDSNDVNLLG